MKACHNKPVMNSTIYFDGFFIKFIDQGHQVKKTEIYCCFKKLLEMA